MTSKLFRNIAIGLVSTALLTACSTSPTGRKQLVLLPDSQLNEMGVASFAEMKSSTPASGSTQATKNVQCVADRIIAVLPQEHRQQAWEVVLFNDEQVNAFALPGYKIGVYTGLLEVAQNQDQLAAVVGHEVGHVLARHSNERVSTQLATSQALALGYQLSGEDSATKAAIFQGLGIGAQIGIILPFSRTHESEADVIGLDLMAKAGFDPEESIKLWQNMSKKGASSTPEFLSTHPSHQTRMQDLNAAMAAPKQIYSSLKAANQAAKCY
ncbi:TPR repeat-containing protein YfgC precursor [Marinomonas aquimarina]|uniref:TPR repeat-containing protein YfgC n=1 Tax=Marinomonas aquimarina TaxID=295068 RepID=A0A1A8T6T6_9GAMM|nr:M48 family metallopeptidase [Marinomonas aquimarina]SBS27455.1 TPR repeat-containing protein YfgC precursor [Marinomonas aquimarina]